MKEKIRGSVRQRTMLTAALAATLVLVGVLALAGVGKAVAAPDATISGQAHIHCTNPGPTNNDFNLFDVTMPDGTVVVGHCIDYGQAAPADGWYDFTGTWNGSSYDITIHSEGATKNPGSMAPYPCQRVGNFTWAPKGSVELQKKSANPSITDGNPCYSLEGAEYGIYSDAACTQLVEKIETDASGYAKSSEMVVGTYWVKETKAPQGFMVDTRTYEVRVEMGSTAKVNGGSVVDMPLDDPAGVLLVKLDAELPNGE